ncbi:cytochrome P450 [Daldinia vernicosa]|uniref:cytochrome P450 n=1 Tax=Daldinia vernicosa TaxID=114800 RepID=UPI0020088FCC|nr:cytochrome P450 [Daldinia vernicosa]KAI0850469.1 cytochrome P450 [Daldinia vernicosa]
MLLIRIENILNSSDLLFVLETIIVVWFAASITVVFYHEWAKVSIPRIGKNPWVSGLWRARAEFSKHGKELTKDGYARYKNSMYRVQTGDMERLVLSVRFLDELRRFPNSILDSRTAVVERNLGWYNRVDIILKSTTHVDVCRTQLIQNLPQVINDQAKDLERVFQLELGACFKSREFHFFNAAETFLNIVNRSMAKLLVGERIHRDEQWLQASLDTTTNTGRLCKDLRGYPEVLRPLIYPFLEARKVLDHNFNIAQILLAKVVSERRRGDQNTDILQWLIDSYKAADSEELDIPFLTNQILFVAIAATRSTASSIVNTIFDAISHVEYQADLRQEIRMALATHGGWCLGALEEMKKLDSFMKESQRLNQHILLSFNRKVRRQITLSNGVTIPPGTFISTPSYWAARDLDGIATDGESFEPWRWLNLREEAERQGKSSVPYLSSTPSSHDLHWGYGRNACPGRFMASAEVKLILAWTLWHFDTSFPKGQNTRPESHFIDERIIPDPKQKIGFRLR